MSRPPGGNADLPTASLVADLAAPGHGHLNVLLVDPDPAYRRSIINQLEDAGHSVTAFSNCNDAWTLLQTVQFDAVILDLETPAMTAMELARRIDGMPQSPAIIATSPNLTSQSRIGRALCRDNGFRDVISKDAGKRNFNHKLKQSLRNARRGPGLEHAE